MNVRNKISIGALALSVVPVVLTALIVGLLADAFGEASLREQAQRQLTSSRDARKSQIEAYMRTVVDQVRTLANDRMTIDAVTELRAAVPRFRAESGINPAANPDQRTALQRYYTQEFEREFARRNDGASSPMPENLGRLSPDTLALQYQYIAANPQPLGAKNALTAAADSSEYSRLHRKYHPHYNGFLQTFGLYDIFIVDPDNGTVVYTVFKELDFQTSLIDGPYADTGLGRVFRKANAMTEPGGVAFDDYEPYLPSYYDQATFVATPIFDNGRKIGVLAMQAPIDRINAIMTANKRWRDLGFGESGETYIVGPDKLMRNDSRFLSEDIEAYLEALRAFGVEPEIIQRIRSKRTSIGLQTVDTPGIRAALAGETGYALFPDYRGIPVFSSYTPLDDLGVGLNWALVSEIDEAEAFAPAATLRRALILWSLLIVALVAGVGLVVTFFGVRGLVRPVAALEATVRKVASGDLSARAPVVSDDEFGQLAKTLNNLLEERLATMADAERNNETLNNSIIRLLEATRRLSERDLTVDVPVSEDVTGTLADAIRQISDAFSGVLHRVLAVAEGVSGASREVARHATSVSEAAAEERRELESAVQQLGEASDAMRQIAALAQTCDQISTAVFDTTRSAYDTVSDTVKGMGEIREVIHETEKRIKRLGERSQEINNIVDIINTIAERTHVLAINASMQAAAAGEEGRGFAVVADEVQRLAENARSATSQISGLVRAIQLETAETADTMGRTVTQVVSGSRLAEQAGVRMEETRRQTTTLVDAVKKIAGSSQDQAKLSVELAAKARTIQQSTEVTRAKLEEQNTQAARLLESAENLLESVHVFKLPPVAASKTGGAPRRRQVA